MKNKNYSNQGYSTSQTGFSNDDFNLDEDKNGYVKVSGKIMKAGDLVYMNIDGSTFTAKISKDELVKASKSANVKPVTNRHPEEMLTPADVKKHSIGVTGDNLEIKSFDGEDWIYGDLILQDQEGINLVKEKKSRGEKINVSAGYYRDAVSLDEKTALFKNIIFNHVAIGVGVPRASGASLDSKEGIKMNNKTLQKNSTFSLDEKDIKYGDDHVDLVASLVEREKSLISKAEGLLEDKQKSMDSLKGANEILTLELEKVNKTLKNSVSMDELNTKVKELTEVKARALSLGIKEDFTDAKEGKSLVLTNIYDKSFDDALIEGAYATLPLEDEKYLKAKSVSNSKLLGIAKKPATSMDSKNNVAELARQLRG